MFAAFIIVSLLAAFILVVVVAARKAPEGYEDKDGFHPGKAPNPRPVVIDEADLSSPVLFEPPEGSIQLTFPPQLED